MSHLTREALSRILDEGADAQARTHLDACEVCRAELAAMGALRTELQRMPAPSVPDTVWSGVIRRLVAEGRVGASGSRGRRFRVPLQAAAAVALLALGFGAGRATLLPGGVETGADAARPATLDAALDRVESTGAAYRLAVSDLQSFESVADPQQRARLAAERLAALDLLANASRAALQVVPEDPVVNGYLYAALQERQRLEASLASSPASGGDVYWR